MAEATALILKQWGVFGAVLVVLGVVIWKLWSDSATTMKTTIATLTADNKALTIALAESNAAHRADHVTMTERLIDMTKDGVAGLTNATNAIEASTAVSADTKLAMRDMVEEMRRGREERKG